MTGNISDYSGQLSSDDYNSRLSSDEITLDNGRKFNFTDTSQLTSHSIETTGKISFEYTPKGGGDSQSLSVKIGKNTPLFAHIKSVGGDSQKIKALILEYASSLFDAHEIGVDGVGKVSAHFEKGACTAILAGGKDVSSKTFTSRVDGKTYFVKEHLSSLAEATSDKVSNFVIKQLFPKGTTKAPPLLVVAICQPKTAGEFSKITNKASIKNLDLSEIDDISSIDLKGFTGLETLKLAKFMMGHTPAKDFSTLFNTIPDSAKATIKTLDLSNVDDVADFEFKDFKSLETLDLNGVEGLTTEQFEAISNKSFIKTLDLSYVDVETFDFKEFASLETLKLAMPMHRYIRGSVPPPPKDFSALFNSIPEPAKATIKTLDLSNMTIPAGFDFKDFKSLETLNLNGVEGLITEQFESIPNKDLIKTLDLSYVNVKDFDFKDFKSLETLNLSDVEGLTTEQFESIPNKALIKTLDLSYVNDVIGFDFKGFDKLETLIVHETKLSAAQYNELPDSPKSSMNYLNLSGIDVTGLNLLGFTSLEYLDLSNTTGSVEDVFNSIPAKAKASISTLNLKDVNVTSLDLSKFAKLKYLNLDNANITILNLKGLNLKNIEPNRRGFSRNNNPLDFSTIKGLETLNLNGAQLTAEQFNSIPDSVKTLDLTGVDTTGFDFSKLINLKSLTGVKGLTAVQLAALPSAVKPSVTVTSTAAVVAGKFTPKTSEEFNTITDKLSVTHLDLNAIVDISALDLSGFTNLSALSLKGDYKPLVFNASRLTANQFNNLPGTFKASLKHVLLENVDVTGFKFSGFSSLDSLSLRSITGKVEDSLNSIPADAKAKITYLALEDENITALDLSGFTSLKDLYVHCDNITALKLDGVGIPVGIDFSKLTKLETLTGVKGLTVDQLKGIPEKAKASIEALDLSGDVTGLDLTGFTGLKILNLTGAQGVTLDMLNSVKGSIEILNLTDVHFSTTDLFLSEFTKLKSLDLSGVSIQTFCLVDATNVKTLTLTNASIKELTLNSIDSKIIDLSILKDTQTLKLALTGDIADAEKAFNSLNSACKSSIKELSLKNPSRITTLDLSGFTKLETLGLDLTVLTTLNLSNCNSLTKESFGKIPKGQITTLDLTGVDVRGFDFSGLDNLENLTGVDLTHLMSAQINALPKALRTVAASAGGIVDGKYTPTSIDKLKSLTEDEKARITELDLSDKDCTGFDFSGLTGLKKLNLTNATNVNRLKLRTLKKSIKTLVLKGTTFSGSGEALSLMEFVELNNLTFGDDTNIKTLNLSSCNKLTKESFNSLPKEKITTLNLTGVDVTGFDFSGFTSLTKLNGVDLLTLTPTQFAALSAAVSSSRTVVGLYEGLKTAANSRQINALMNGLIGEGDNGKRVGGIGEDWKKDGLIFSDLPAYKDKVALRLRPQETIDNCMEAMGEIAQISTEKTRHNNKTQALLEKKVVALDTEVITTGDLHGDGVSLARMLEKLQLDGKLDKNFKLADNIELVFLGDYVDRGPDSWAVLNMLTRLKLNNMDQVHLIRGNHEDTGQIDDEASKYGEWMGHEGAGAKDEVNRLNLFFNTLPNAIFLGVENSGKTETEYDIYTHGAVPLSFNPNKMLSGEDGMNVVLRDARTESTSVDNYNFTTLNEASTKLKGLANKVEGAVRAHRTITDLVVLNYIKGNLDKDAYYVYKKYLEDNIIPLDKKSLINNIASMISKAKSDSSHDVHMQIDSEWAWADITVDYDDSYRGGRGATVKLSSLVDWMSLSEAVRKEENPSSPISFKRVFKGHSHKQTQVEQDERRFYFLDSDLYAQEDFTMHYHKMGMGSDKESVCYREYDSPKFEGINYKELASYEKGDRF
jgi:hypothetical protein